MTLRTPWFAAIEDTCERTGFVQGVAVPTPDHPRCWCNSLHPDSQELTDDDDI